MDIQTRASLAATRLLQLKTTIKRVRDVVVLVDTVPVGGYKLPYECIAVGAATTKALLAAGAPVVAAYWPTVAADTMNPADLKFFIATPNFEIPGTPRLVMEDFGDRYPHLGEWDGSSADAVAKLAGLLRYGRVVRYVSNDATQNLKHEEVKHPELHLIVQLWVPPVARRWRELCRALRRNAENPFVSKIHVLMESDAVADAWSKWPADLVGKLVCTSESERLTFRRFRDIALKVVPADGFVAFMNADIYFDGTIRELWSADMKRTCLALLRYEATMEGDDADAKLFGPRDDSQDAWIFRVADLAAEEDASWSPLNFMVGRAGCDNAFAGELVRRKWRVANPCMTIRALHIHESAHRTYREDDRISLGVYATVAPTGLLESPLLGAGAFKVANKATIPVVQKYNVAALSGPEGERGMDTLYKTVMPAKIGGEFEFEEKMIHILEAPAGAICTEDGLVAVGDGIGWSEDQDASDLAWTQTTYSSLTPTVQVKRGIFLPLRARHLGDELLQVGRALWIAERVGRQDLVLPVASARALQPLVAGHLELRALGTRAMVCTEAAYGLLPSFTRLSADWLDGAVSALRRIASRVKADEGVSWTTFDLDVDVADQLEDALDLEDKEVRNFVNRGTAPQRIIAALKRSDVVIGGAWSTGYMWAARPGTLYLDLAPEAANAAMATICGLRYVPLTFKGDVSAPVLLECAMRALKSDDV